MRGTCAPIRKLSLTQKAEEAFEISLEMNVVSNADLYGGKLCAALDRQHPRDLFDIKLLLENEGITDEIRQGFIVYLISHDRPMSELIKPTQKDIAHIFKSEFEGMAVQPVTLDSLLKARTKMIDTLSKGLTSDERKFILSIKTGNPDWSLFKLKGIEKLPGVQWKLMNIKKMNKTKQAESFDKLKKKLQL